MNITIADIRTLQRVEAGMPDAIIGRVMRQGCEILRQCVGSANYNTLDALPATDPIIAGGQVGGENFEGLQSLLSDLVFALLATENRVITGFGTVEKVDDYSRSADFFDQCKAKEAHFREGVQRLCALKSWKYQYPDSDYYTTKFFTDGKLHR